MDEAKPLPTHVEELDALAIENAQLKAEKALMIYEAAVTAFKARMTEAGKRYDFNPETVRIDFASRAIVRP